MNAESERSFLFISNGYGEDAVSARVARELARQRPSATLAAFPTVGDGGFYEDMGIRLAGRGPRLPSEGFVRSLGAFWRDVRHGFFEKTLRLGREIGSSARGRDFLVMTGDPYLLLFTSLFTRHERSRKIFIGVQQSEWYGTKKPFKHRYSAVERHWLRRMAGLVFVRDRRTGDFLRAKGLVHAGSEGNPMMDCFEVSENPVFPGDRTLIGILPGSKLEAYENLKVTFDVVRLLAIERNDLLFAFALSKTLDEGRIAKLFALEPAGVRATGARSCSSYRLPGCGATVLFSSSLFGDIINESAAVIGTSGTGNEQAAGLGRPVFGFWGKGPQITKKFMVAQKKLLGRSLFLNPPEPGRIARDILAALEDENLLSEVRRNGILRMEGRGSVRRIVERICRYVDAERASREPPAWDGAER